MDKLEKGRWWILITGILAVIAGVLYLMNPVEGSLILVQIIGAMFVVAGIFHIVTYFTAQSFVSGYQIVAGLLDILVGVLCFMNTVASGVAFVMILIFWMMFSGILLFASSFDMKKMGYSGWWAELLVGILGIVFSVILLNGGALLQATYFTLLISIYLFTIGFDLIATFFSINSALKKLNQ